MEIVSVDFEGKMVLEINGVKISIQPFKEHDKDVIKLGVDAPRNVVVNREEVHLARKKLSHLEKKEMDERITGIIKFYNAEKGFGFAQIKHTNDDVLLTKECFIRGMDTYNLWEGDKVRMKIKRTAKGLIAKEVQLAK